MNKCPYFDKSCIPCIVKLHYKYMQVEESYYRLNKLVEFLNTINIPCSIQLGEGYGPCYCLDVEDEVSLETAEAIYDAADKAILPAEFRYIPEHGFYLVG